MSNQPAEFNNPNSAQIQSIRMMKFDKSSPINLMPQYIECVIYQSIFSNILKADLLLSDFIGLMNNYPITGEEYITINIIQFQPNSTVFSRQLNFIITKIDKISISDDTRQTAYVLRLSSVDALLNVNGNVSKAFYDTTEEMIKSVYLQYLSFNNFIDQKSINVYSTTQKIRKLIIPNLKPFEAINWLCRMSISSNPQKEYTPIFFENLNGYMFKTIQKPTFQGAVDYLAYYNSLKNKYFYISNIELIKANLDIFQQLTNLGFSENRVITDIQINNRFSTLEKIVSGYLQNDYVEINMLQKDHKITYSELNYDDSNFTTLKRNQPSTNNGFGFHTQKFVNDIKSLRKTPETGARTRYVINNYDDLNQPSYRDKFGNSSRSMTAFKQLDLTVSIYTDLNLMPSDLFYLQLPEMHGFNIETTDLFLSGFYMISEIKNIFRQGGKTSTQLRLNRDSFETSVDIKSKYNDGDLTIEQKQENTTLFGV